MGAFSRAIKSKIQLINTEESQLKSTKKEKFGDYGNKSRIKGINEMQSLLFLPLIEAIPPINRGLGLLHSSHQNLRTS